MNNDQPKDRSIKLDADKLKSLSAVASEAKSNATPSAIAPSYARKRSKTASEYQGIAEKARTVAREAMAREQLKQSVDPNKGASPVHAIADASITDPGAKGHETPAPNRGSNGSNVPAQHRPNPVAALPAFIQNEVTDKWFHPASGKYLVRDSRSKYQAIPEHNLERKLVNAGLEKYPAKGETASETSLALGYIDHHCTVDYYGPVGGYEQGVIDMCGKRILVNDEAELIEAVPGDWPVLRSVIENMLGEEQTPYFYGWLKTAMVMLRAREWQPGQALVLAGPPNCGKSLMQKILTPLFGNRQCNPYAYMTEKTTFNGQLGGATLWVIDDEVESSAPNMRGKLGTKLKAFCCTEILSVEAKYQMPILLIPLRRLFITLNDTARCLRVLPSLDNDMKDKIMLLRAEYHPMPEEEYGGRAGFLRQLISELPAFLAFLLDWEIPKEIRDQRYGVRHFHNRNLLKIMRAGSDEGVLLECIEAEILGNPLNCVRDDKDPSVLLWEGRAVDLERTLMSGETCRDTARNLLRSAQQCGTLLGRLATQFPHRFKSRLRNGLTYWTILSDPFDSANDLDDEVAELRRCHRNAGKPPQYAVKHLRETMEARKAPKDSAPPFHTPSEDEGPK